MKAHDPHTWYGKNGKELWIDDELILNGIQKEHVVWHV